MPEHDYCFDVGECPKVQRPPLRLSSKWQELTVKIYILAIRDSQPTDINRSLPWGALKTFPYSFLCVSHIFLSPELLSRGALEKILLHWSSKLQVASLTATSGVTISATSELLPRTLFDQPIGWWIWTLMIWSLGVWLKGWLLGLIWSSCSKLVLSFGP